MKQEGILENKSRLLLFLSPSPLNSSLTSSPLALPRPRSYPHRLNPMSPRRRRCCRCRCRPCASSSRRPPAAAGPRTTRTSLLVLSVRPASHLDPSKVPQSPLIPDVCLAPFLFNVRSLWFLRRPFFLLAGGATDGREFFAQRK